MKMLGIKQQTQNESESNNNQINKKFDFLPQPIRKT